MYFYNFIFRLLLEEFNKRGLLRDLQDKKTDNMRRRKRKDLLRLQIIRIVEVVFFRGIFKFDEFIDLDNVGSTSSILFEIFDIIRTNVENDTVKFFSLYFL